MKQLQVIAFDADDTLWINEPYFREAEEKVCQLLQDYLPVHSTAKELYKTEIANLPLYGYGGKGFMLSMIEAALSISQQTVDLAVIERIIEIGKALLDHPVQLLDGVEATLQRLAPHYRLVVATKGDLLEQQRKLDKSGLAPYFHHIEIMSEKHADGYQQLLRHLDIGADGFMMIGNSLKSDVLPVLAIGGHAVHIPFHTTWLHEQIDHHVEHPQFHTCQHLAQVADLLLA